MDNVENVWLAAEIDEETPDDVCESVTALFNAPKWAIFFLSLLQALHD